MIGDRLTDVECGRAAGVKTILVGEKGRPARLTGAPGSDYVAADLADAVKIVLGEELSG